MATIRSFYCSRGRKSYQSEHKSPPCNFQSAVGPTNLISWIHRTSTAKYEDGRYFVISRLCFQWAPEECKHVNFMIETYSRPFLSGGGEEKWQLRLGLLSWISYASGQVRFFLSSSLVDDINSYLGINHQSQDLE